MSIVKSSHYSYIGVPTTFIGWASVLNTKSFTPLWLTCQTSFEEWIK